ncbi:MAG: hypothetical protein VR71_11665 [Roseovarius sp. BRH_c41]|uniref:3-hydroxyacyl-CoA dehydrogenase NAD-binding domain-containing protein n=1 Tax=Roseovarius sp. BRH_c41 TaxID=1629709 RepID=UPI00061EC38D|nr:3-hydroxyacyl-CoA dehydrogenase NAD-binding domain-containing protein [Roseovarius sp. BRH_c41]KJS43206.1 MAG: hypothetical protein VR71_11665 [Roseovarius sp. BRH_c41]
MDDAQIRHFEEQKPVAVIGAGLIGCSWASLFAASGMEVRVHDPRPDTSQLLPAFWEDVRPTLKLLGHDFAEAHTPNFVICDTVAEAVEGAWLIKECIPERLDLKQSLYAQIEPVLAPDAIVATSSSGLKLSDLQAFWTDPSRLIIAHPFNPPHLIPLVELYGNDLTAPDIIPLAKAFFEGCGKVTITLKREVPAHVANRLQAALWREAIHLVTDGVASVEDVDTAVWAGPGLRWAIMGPHMLLNLGGGEGGLRAYVGQFADHYAEWWDDLGRPQLTQDTVDALVEGISQEAGSRDYRTLRAERDSQILALLRSIRPNLRQSAGATPV